MAGAIVLTLISALAINWAYLREHEVASSLPPFLIRKPLAIVRALVTNRRWLVGFGVETAGFLCFVVALALAPLAIVQSLAAGGIGILAFLTSRIAGVKLFFREVVGVLIAMAGLSLLGLSLFDGADEGPGGRWWAIAAWLAACAALAALALSPLAKVIGRAAAQGAAAGMLFAAGDVATETVVTGGTRLAFLPAMIAGYALGTAALQLGFQRGGALTTAGIATLLTNAVPIAAGTIVYQEPFPDGVLGVIRGLAFGLLVLGAVLLAQPRGAPREAVAAEPETRVALV